MVGGSLEFDGGDRELATICGASGAVKRGLDHGSIEGDICAAGGSDTMEVDDMGCPKHTSFLGKNKHYLDNDAVAPKEKVNFILKSLEKNFYTMLHSLRSGSRSGSTETTSREGNVKVNQQDEV